MQLEPLNVPAANDPFVLRTTGPIKHEQGLGEHMGTVLENTEPWEGMFNGYYNVVEIDGELRMYYRSCQLNMPDTKELSCVAISKTGHPLQFNKPKLGRFKHQGAPTNIVHVGRESHNLFVLPRLSDGRLIAIGGYSRSTAQSLAYLESHDGGLTWGDSRTFLEPSQLLPSFHYFDCQTTLHVDPRGYFRLFTRHNVGTGQREIQTATSTDLRQWTAFEQVQWTESTGKGLYTPGTTPYPGLPGAYLCATTYQNGSSDVSKRAYLGFSKEGTMWHLLRQRPLGVDGLPAVGVPGVVVRGEHWYFYVQTLYVCRVDCFRFKAHRIAGHVNPEKVPGTVESVPIKLASGGLLVNYKCGAGGAVMVEAIADDTDTVEASQQLRGDAVRAPVHWKLSPRHGVAYRFRFTLIDATLYAIEFKPNI
jgi:hypothetical protein